MERFEGIQEGPLTIKRPVSEKNLIIVFEGKSILRDPTEILQPILFQVLDESDDSDHRLELDFRGLSYMNSSTFTPIIKTLEKARLGDSKVTVVYSSDQKWQAVSFAALTIFDTGDGRISIEGKEED